MNLINSYKCTKRYEFFEITLKVLEGLGGSERINEIHIKILNHIDLPDEVIKYRYGIGTINYRKFFDYLIKEIYF